MTREEAIERLKQNKAAAEYYAGQSRITAEIENALKDNEAFDMAIEALSADTVATIQTGQIAKAMDYCYDCEAVEVCKWYPHDGCEFKISRPTGEWIDVDNYCRLATCSNCQKVTMFEKWGEYTKPYNFCPNCGADMRGGEDE